MSSFYQMKPNWGKENVKKIRRGGILHQKSIEMIPNSRFMECLGKNLIYLIIYGNIWIKWNINIYIYPTVLIIHDFLTDKCFTVA